MFGKSSSYGFNRVTGSTSGPVAGGLTVFLGGDLEGRQSFQPGKGRIDTSILVQRFRIAPLVGKNSECHEY